jgi:secreted PhoX family phosphatase
MAHKGPSWSAFLAANLVGGTPTARPEDKEIHPQTKEVFIAFTDGVPGSDGYADSRIFQVSKYTTDVNAAQPSGGLYKIIEDSRDGSGLTFHWQRFVQAGEAGAVDGVGFANVDNLVFDFNGNVWGVTDMSTSNHNGFNVGPNPEPRAINHALAGSSNAANLVGVFGNNWLFYIPTSGPEAGTVVPLAYGPMRCEMTGPTFVGNTLIISIQHPGEDSPIGSQNNGLLSRDIELLSLAGRVFTQKRTSPKGSVWPSNILGKGLNLPTPATIGIRRKAGRAHWQADDGE